MKNIILVKDYTSKLDVYETQLAIKLCKDTFESLLSKELDLMRVTAPLFVDPLTGLNDNLSGKENAVSFKIPSNKDLEIVQSLAKWKRYALNKYNADGIYTDMNAIRMHEDLDNIHSIYVDQWDWEKRITVNDRNISYLKEIVNKIYKVLKTTQKIIHNKFPALNNVLPDKIHYITSSELEDLYPDLSRKEREYEITKKHGAVFLIGIGNKLKDGVSHDSRASDYDDWNLNGDLLVYYSTLDIALELSSMGIRVDKEALLHQLKEKKEEFKLDLPYHKAILENTLPLTIGGGIGQSRICMYLLNKAHIGEVQVSYWNKEDIELFKRNNIHLL